MRCVLVEKSRAAAKNSSGTPIRAQSAALRFVEAVHALIATHRSRSTKKPSSTFFEIDTEICSSEFRTLPRGVGRPRTSFLLLAGGACVSAAAHHSARAALPPAPPAPPAPPWPPPPILPPNICSRLPMFKPPPPARLAALVAAGPLAAAARGGLRLAGAAPPCSCAMSCWTRLPRSMLIVVPPVTCASSLMVDGLHDASFSERLRPASSVPGTASTAGSLAASPGSALGRPTGSLARDLRCPGGELGRSVDCVWCARR